MIPVRQKYSLFIILLSTLLDIDEQDRFYKQVYNDLSVIFEQSEKSINFDELSLAPIKQSLAQLYTIQDQKYQSSTEEENGSQNSYQTSTNEYQLPIPSTFKRMVKSFNDFSEMEENIGKEADDFKELQFPFELCVKFIQDLKQTRFKFNSF